MTREMDRPDGTKVRVEVGRPRPFVEGETDSCVPFRIGNGPVLEAGGVDGVQAMVIALGMIGDLAKSDGLTFLGTGGFPVTVPADDAYVSVHREPVDVLLLDPPPSSSESAGG